MELRRTETGFALYKEKEVIGHCTLHPAAQGAALAALAIDPAWRRKGYGSYLLKEVCRCCPHWGNRCRLPCYRKRNSCIPICSHPY